MSNKYIQAGLCLIAFSLGACSSTKESFDFSQKAPDEFAVVKRAPLELPPNYTLRPPTPGAARPQEQAATEQAQEAIFGGSADNAKKTAKTSASSGEQILLQKSGAAQTNPDIRNIIDQETYKLGEETKPTFDKIIGVTGKKYEAPAKTIDPVKERERIIKEGKAE